MLKFKTVAFYQPMLIKEVKTNVLFEQAVDEVSKTDLTEVEKNAIILIEIYRIISNDLIVFNLVHDIIFLEFNISLDGLQPLDTYVDLLGKFIVRSKAMNEYIAHIMPANDAFVQKQKNRSRNGIFLEWSHFLNTLMLIGFSKIEAENISFYEGVKVIEAYELQAQLDFNNSILGQAYSAGNLKPNALKNGIKQFKDL
jgi:hypothetical protein